MSDCGGLTSNQEYWWGVLVFVLNAFWERWLGRTNKTRAASTLDLIQVGFRKLFGIKQKTTLVIKEGEPMEGPKE